MQPFSRLQYSISLLVASLYVVASLSGCGMMSGEIAQNDYGSGSSLAISPATVTVELGGSIQFTASGGHGPYTFATAAAMLGTIDPATGAFTAPDKKVGKVNVTVTDAIGNSDVAEVTVNFAGLSSIDSITGFGMRLHWSAVAGAKYKIYRIDGSTPILVDTITDSAAVSYDVSGLSNNTQYTFRVRMLDFFDAEDSNTVDRSATTSTTASTFNGWSHLKAIGGTNPVTQAIDLTPESASVTLRWNAISFPSGSADSYNIYRSTSSGGQDFLNPLASSISANARSYTDSTVLAENTYYYVVRPVVGSEVIPPTPSTDLEIEVKVPPANMALVHRWLANREICVEMGLSAHIDRDNNYRCPYLGLANNGGYFDIAKSYYIDMFEAGCNYTTTSATGCSANGCIGASDPPAADAAYGDPGDV
jgi:hypothetical protein